MAQKGNTSTERLKEEGGREREETLGIPLDGTADPTGEFPKRYNWYGNSQSAAGRGVRINKVNVQGGSLDMNFDLSAPSPSIYPFNYAMESPIGHSFEIDDTPGNERILIKHHTGGGIEIQPDGVVVISSAGKGVYVTNGDYNLSVTGDGHMTYEGNLHMKVNGNYNLDVSGTYNLNVGNNFNNQVHGTMITETGDAHQTIVRGNKDTKIYGDNNDFIVGEKKIISKKDIRMLSKRDIISNAHRHVRMTAEEKITGSSGNGLTLSSEKVYITGRRGKIGGNDFHHIGSLFTGPSGNKGDRMNDQGKKTVFHGNLVGRALEAWTSKYSLYAAEAHAAWRADHARNATLPTSAAIVDYEIVIAKQKGGASKGSSIKEIPDYKFDWGWGVDENTVFEQQLDMLENYEWDGKGNRDQIDPLHISPFYGTNEDWFEVWNKVSPFAVRKVIIDEDNWIEKKLYKPSVYSHYFHSTPDTAEIRSKLRTMDGANDPKTSPEMQTDHDKAEAALLFENRLSQKYQASTPPSPYKIKRSGNDFKSRYGYTLMGNPVERASKTFTPKNKAQSRQLLIDPKYNPYRQESPISASTKLSKTCSMATFLGAVGSKASLEAVPIDEDRMDLARYWVCHAQILEGVNSSPLFSGHRLAVTEGYYTPNSGIREHYKPGEDVEKKFWREPYRNEDGGIKNRTLSGHPTNQRKHEGMLVYYTLFDSRGKIDYSKTWECALYIRDNFYFRELYLDYDITRPDDVMTVQIGIYMPVIGGSDFEGYFEQKMCTYFNRARLKENDLLEITDL